MFVYMIFLFLSSCPENPLLMCVFLSMILIYDQWPTLCLLFKFRAGNVFVYERKCWHASGCFPCPCIYLKQPAAQLTRSASIVRQACMRTVKVGYVKTKPIVGRARPSPASVKYEVTGFPKLIRRKDNFWGSTGSRIAQAALMVAFIRALLL